MIAQVSSRFQELDWRATPIGDISLRRHWNSLFDKDIYEIKLDDDFLMSSMFTVAEIEVARLALARLTGTGWDVAVGGLGLGYTALTVLESTDVASLIVIEALGEVIEWHERGLIPAGPTLAADARCRLVAGNFFESCASAQGLDPSSPGRRFHAIIVDIDHSPRHLLNPANAGFYQPAGLRRLAEHLHPGGIFSLWSNDPPDEPFMVGLREVFATVEAQVVSFANPLQDHNATNTVYLAQ